ncbi:Cache 3/Cache 2 fusion domain-containing protein [Desulfoplanes sp.]
MKRFGTMDANRGTAGQATNQVTKSRTNVSLPKMALGTEWLGQNAEPGQSTPIVDKLKSLTGTTCTVFQTMNPQGDLLRVATNILKNDGKRAIGTYIPSSSPVAQTVRSGATYYGTAYVVNAWYLTQYRPIMDNQGRVIGCLYVGILQENVKQLRQGLMEMTIGSTFMGDVRE